MTVFIASVYGASTLIANSWKRFNENPTVITIQKNYKEWNVTFPAATFCFIDNLDMEKARIFIKETWNVDPSEEDVKEDKNTEDDVEKESLPSIEFEDDIAFFNENITLFSTNIKYPVAVDVVGDDVGGNISKYRYYKIFLQRLVNQTYENMKLFKLYTSDDTLRDLNILKTILKVIKNHTISSTFYRKDFNNRQFYPTPTEMGMCYVHGGKLADYVSLTGQPRNRKLFELPTCNYLNTICYARTEGTPSDVRYYVHSPYEIPDISSTFFPVRGRMDRDVSFNCLETIVSERIYGLRPSQRHCYFMNEPIVSHIKVVFQCVM